MSLINALGNTATEDTAQDGNGLLRRIVALLSSPRGYDKAQARHRGTVVVESGTVTTATTVGTITNIGSGRDAGQMIVNPINRTSWALNHRSRIS